MQRSCLVGTADRYPLTQIEQLLFLLIRPHGVLPYSKRVALQMYMNDINNDIINASITETGN